MKTQTLYLCEFCGTQYKVRDECVACEKAHVFPEGIVDTKYVTYKNDRTGYPTKISVKMIDGKVVDYHR